MTEQEEIINTIKVLRKEVEVLTTRLRPAGTGYLITAIDVINGRIDELIGSAIDGQPDQIGDLTSKIYGEDVYSGYQEHTEAIEQARLRKIQDSAAGRWSANKQGHWSPDDGVEFNGPFGMDEKKYTHTKEYYTGRDRNRPMEGEDLPITDPFTEGLSNRSMKQKYGHAVQTTSEMMQDELEPLPINTFE